MRRPGSSGPASITAAAFASSGFENRSEEHTSELQSRSDLVCRLLLEKKKKIQVTFLFRSYFRRKGSCLPVMVGSSVKRPYAHQATWNRDALTRGAAQRSVPDFHTHTR